MKHLHRLLTTSLGKILYYNICFVPSVPEGPPLALAGVSLDSRTLHLTWQPPVSSLRNGVIREYRINITEMETSTTSHYSTSGSQSYTVASLHPFYNYQCTVAAYTVGLGPFSDLFFIQMPETCEHFQWLFGYQLATNVMFPYSQVLMVPQWISLLPKCPPPMLTCHGGLLSHTYKMVSSLAMSLV